jgi:hypothetical protein
MRHSALEDVDVAKEVESHERLASRIVCQHVEVESVISISRHVQKIRVNRHSRREISKSLVNRDERLRVDELID